MPVVSAFRAAAAAAFIVIGATAPAYAQSADEAVKAAYAAWDAAFNSGDGKAVAAAYTEDALFLPPTHAVINGPGGIAAFFDGLFDAGVTGHTLELIEAEDVGDGVVAAGRWSASGKGADGAVAPVGGIATHVFVRDGSGALKLRVHTFN